MTDIPFTVFSCLGFVLCIPPAYFNWKIPGRPWATLIFIGWICVFNGFSFIDSIIWSGPDPAEWWDGKVYCDIFSRVKSVFQIGLPAAGIGICRFLADATNPDPATTDLAHTRFRRNMIDLFLGVGLPLINIGLKVIVNPTRFCILGVSGCNGITDLSWPAVLLYHVWCPVLSCIAGIYAGSFPFAQKVYVVIFLRHWWVRRKRLNEEWGTGTRRGISRTEFRRLQFTILSVIFFYLPFSLWYFVQVVKLPKIPFSWDRIHGPQWEYITKISMPKANLSQWLGPVMAFTSFFFIGLTRNARVFYEHRVEWIYDHLPKRLQEKLPGMQKTSRLCKERRAAKETYRYGEDRNISMVERQSKGRAAKNWFDSDDDIDDTSSLPSTEATLAGKDEEDSPGQVQNQQTFGPLRTTTKVSTGEGRVPVWSHGVSVTRQVIVETSSAVPPNAYGLLK